MDLTGVNASVYIFHLYVAGASGKSMTAQANLRRICEDYLREPYVIEVIDLLKDRHLARQDGIIALPTVVRKQPLPVKRVVGDLSDTDKVVKSLDLIEALVVSKY